MTRTSLSPKLRLRERVAYPHHRSGWKFALSALDPLFCKRGILFDSFSDRTFGRYLDDSLAHGVLPFAEPWVGCIHIPPGVPGWHDVETSPQRYLQHSAWKRSLPWCHGLITFSAWMKQWIEQRVDVPVLAVTHPTEAPRIQFSMESFQANPRPRVIQVGFWLRRLHSIYALPLRKLGKALLNPACSEEISRRWENDWRQEALQLGERRPPLKGVERWPHQPAKQYDELLAENLVFLHLYDAVATNTIIECIVRHTPVLVNRLPSVEEYLGKDYPFYFQTMEEAADKAQDLQTVEQAHRYLREMPKERFSKDYFLRSIAESDLYRSLPPPRANSR